MAGGHGRAGGCRHCVFSWVRRTFSACPSLYDNRTVPFLAPAPYWLYLLECEGGVYYAGIALDVERRFFQHVFGVGARFTRARPPVRVLAARQYASKGDALRAELQLKSLPRAEKLAFFVP
ncbi:MAG: GIY-YIG nuclease family protein [Comamonadaceae bacterium]|nr:MAG: GIY-YIG nuclease family protein [Comamonadaceae bacterium]